MKIFLFHRVHPTPDPLWCPIHPDRFRDQVNFLARNYEIVPMEKYILGDYVPPGKKPPGSIVFDDGYIDFSQYALPILQDLSLTPSLYVVTNCANTGMPIWTYQLDWVFQNTKKSKIDGAIDGMPSDLKSDWKTEQEKFSCARKLKALLKEKDHSSRIHALDQIFSAFDDVSMPSGMMMEWDLLRQIGDEGVEIGSHTASHPLLATMADELDITRELYGSFERIEEMLGQKPVAIAYPNGSFDERVMRLSGEAGYKIGLAVLNRPYRPQRDSIYAIPRIELYQEPMWKTRARASGMIRVARRLKHAFRL